MGIDDQWSENGMITLAKIRLVPDVWSTSEPLSVEDIAKAQEEDPVTRELMTDSLKDTHVFNQYVDQWINARRDLVYKGEDGIVRIRSPNHPNSKQRDRIVIPESLTLQVIQQEHVGPDCAHRSSPYMLARLKTKYDWPGMTTQVRDFCRTCRPCQRRNVKRGHQGHGLDVTPNLPFQIMACDFAEMGGKEPSYPSRFKHVLVVIDVLTRYILLVLVRSTKACEVIRALHQRVFPQCGVP